MPRGPLRAVAAFATSTKNLVGLALAIVGLVLHFVGVVGSVWPLVVVGLYLVGAFATPPGRRPLAIGPEGAAVDADSVRRALNTLEGQVAVGVPDALRDIVHRIDLSILELLRRVQDQPAASEDVYVLAKMATDYLPGTIDAFQRLPLDYAMTHKGADGRTPYQMALTQLQLLDAKVKEISDAMLKGDSDALAAHGRFLEDRFATSSLALDGDDATTATPAAAPAPDPPAGPGPSPG